MKKSILLCTMLFLTLQSFSQQIDTTALIIIDIQNFYFPGGAVELSEPEMAAEKAKQLLIYFRENNGLVVHVRHNFDPGGEIHDLVKPVEGEKIFSKSEVNAFLNTGLNEYLQRNNIKNVVLCGMQTHMCLEAGTRAARDLGYNCVVVEDACTTRDLKYNDVVVKATDVHYSTLVTLKSYGNVVTLQEFWERQNKQ